MITVVSQAAARRALLCYHYLLPPRSLSGYGALQQIMDRIRCIQVDPMNTVGVNANLVLQARIRGYKPGYLERALHRDRFLIEGWDKLRSIFRVEDWPYLNGFRTHMRAHHARTNHPPREIVDAVLAELIERGPSSSLDLTDHGKGDWRWAESKLTRASLDILFDFGEIGVFGRVGARKVYAPIRQVLRDGLLPEEANPALHDPHGDSETCVRWHIEQRVHAQGIAAGRAGDGWLGLVGVKTAERNRLLDELVTSGRLAEISIDGDRTRYFVPPSLLQDLNALGDDGRGDGHHPQHSHGPEPRRQVSFIAPLDNLMWDRRLIRELFGFDYTWEVYKPAAQRTYGYYVLPILYGDRFVARWEPRRDGDRLRVLGFWWEAGADTLTSQSGFRSAFGRAVREFMSYLGVRELCLEPTLGQAEREFLKTVAEYASLNTRGTES